MDIYSFLKNRDIDEKILTKMKEDKIDEETIQGITDCELAQYSTKLGDRVALRTFCSQRKTTKKTKRTKLFEELKRKIEKDNHEESCSEENATKSGIGRKLTRKVEMGWIHDGKQVRKRQGGGTRKTDVHRLAVKKDLIEEGKKLFFPNGISTKGRLEEFNVDILDFKETSLPDFTTVAECYNEFKTGIVSFYLHTSFKSEASELSTRSEITEDTSSQSSTENVTRSEVSEYVNQFGELNENMSSEMVYNMEYYPDTDLLPFVEIDQLNSGMASSQYEQTQEYLNQGNTSQEYVAAGTPTVAFRRGLSLQHRRSEKPTPDQLTHRRQEQGTSSRPIPVLDVLDSEDEEIAAAIEASLRSPDTQSVRTPVSSSGRGLEEVLKEMQMQAVHEDGNPTKIIILRSNVLQSALKALDRKCINLNARLYVKFSGEIGEDFGGPRREFFRLAIKAVHESNFFEGPENAKVFTHDISMLEKKQYQLLGRLVALSLVQEGPGLHFFNGHLYDMMVGREVDLTSVELSLTDDLNELIRKIEDVDTEEKRNQFLQDHADELIDRGFGNPYIMSVDEKGDIIRMLKKHYLYYRISNEIDQFKQGMNEVGGAWHFIKDHADQFKPLFCHSLENLTAKDIESLFKFKYSECGSNDRVLEDVTVYAWELFVQSIEEGGVPVTFHDLLSFTTGADHIPPCGFTKPIDIMFYNQESGKSTRLPFASTCSLQFWLPRDENPESLSRLLVTSIKESSGFFKV